MDLQSQTELSDYAQYIISFRGLWVVGFFCFCFCFSVNVGTLVKKTAVLLLAIIYHVKKLGSLFISNQ